MKRAILIASCTISFLLISNGMAGQSPILGEPGSDEQQRAVIAEIRSAAAEERRLLIDISVNCKWPTDTDTYLIRDHDSIAAECQRERRRYTIEFLQKDHGQLSGKRELDRQLSQAAMLELDLLTSVFAIKSVYERRAIMADAPGTFTSSEKLKARKDYADAEQSVYYAARALNNFYYALGICLSKAR